MSGEYCESGIVLATVWIATYSSKQSLGTAKGQIEDAGKSKGIEIATEGGGVSGGVRCRDQSRVTGEKS